MNYPEGYMPDDRSFLDEKPEGNSRGQVRQFPSRRMSYEELKAEVSYNKKEEETEEERDEKEEEEARIAYYEAGGNYEEEWEPLRHFYDERIKNKG